MLNELKVSPALSTCNVIAFPIVNKPSEVGVAITLLQTLVERGVISVRSMSLVALGTPMSQLLALLQLGVPPAPVHVTSVARDALADMSSTATPNALINRFMIFCLSSILRSILLRPSRSRLSQFAAARPPLWRSDDHRRPPMSPETLRQHASFPFSCVTASAAARSALMVRPQSVPRFVSATPPFGKVINSQWSRARKPKP